MSSSLFVVAQRENLVSSVTEKSHAPRGPRSRRRGDGHALSQPPSQSMKSTTRDAANRLGRTKSYISITIGSQMFLFPRARPPPAPSCPPPGTAAPPSHTPAGVPSPPCTPQTAPISLAPPPSPSPCPTRRRRKSNFCVPARPCRAGAQKSELRRRRFGHMLELVVRAMQIGAVRRVSGRLAKSAGVWLGRVAASVG